MPASFLFYDLETFGRDPRRSRIAQFAAIRTDSELRQVDEPLSLFVQPAEDLLPSPAAAMLTGITPQQALRQGVNEAEAFARIFEEMARPETCTLGYNSLRFDDEFVRHGLFRNFYDAYEREWRGGNSRWDLLDVMRLAHALRPDGIVWPAREDGSASFKLEPLAVANEVRSGDAHEALSDVRALLGLARKLRAAQPKLWEYALRLRDKRYVAQLLDSVAMKPVLHISQRYPASRLCAAAVVPLARHPRIDSRMIVFDLDGDLDTLFDLTHEAIAERLYTPSADLPEGVARVPLKEVHLNKSPAVIAWQYLRESDFQRLQIDPDKAQANAARLRAAGPALAEKLRRVYANRQPPASTDVDASLYDGFVGDSDKRRCAQVRTTDSEKLAGRDFGFTDTRLRELLFRYRARNWPQSLGADERVHWDDYRRQRLSPDSGLAELSLEAFERELALMRSTHANDAGKLELLDQLQAWGKDITTSLQPPQQSLHGSHL